MRLEVLHDLDDPQLQSDWESLARAGGPFAQSTHAWNHAWWKHLQAGRRLHVVRVATDAGELCGLAPMVLEKGSLGLRCLRSMPVHFSDYYTWLIDPQRQPEETVRALLDYLHSFAGWDLVCLEQINSGDARLFPALAQDARFTGKKVVDCLRFDFKAATWNDYLGLLKANHRGDVKRRLKIMQAERTVGLELHREPGECAALLCDLQRIYSKRWADDYRPQRSPAYQAAYDEAVLAMIRQKRMLLYLVRLDGQPAAYTLGFDDANYCYIWQMSHDPQFQRYSIGVMMIALITRDLMERGYRGVDFMAGYYPWKVRWAPEPLRSTNQAFWAASRSWRARLFLWYQFRCRDTLKALFHRMTRHEWGRALSRRLLAGMQHKRSPV